MLSDMKHHDYKGYEAASFKFKNSDCTIVFPEAGKKNGSWVWRAEFLGAFDSVDTALLKKGWHIAYCALSDMFGCPEAVSRMKAFHDMLISEFALNQKADIFGFSRGGLYAFNYALAHPDDISVLYLDAPVLDLHSWPFSRGNAIKSPDQAEMCMKWYGLTPETAADFKSSPIDRTDELFATAIPVLLIAGGADEVLPYEENGEILDQKMKAINYNHLTILKPNCGHHPHSLENPTPAVEFIEKNRRV